MKNTDCYKVNSCPCSGSAPIPQEGFFTQVKNIQEISGFSHGCGKCAPRQGVCKLTLNVKNGIIQEALVETVGCSGMTHSACMAGEILIGKTLLEALNTDLVCDAINDAMKDIFQQLAYGRSQSAFSIGGLPIGAAVEELGRAHHSKTGTVYSSNQTGVRYYNTTEGYITKLALDEHNEVIGYEYVNLPRLLTNIRAGIEAQEALQKSSGTYGRFEDAVKILDTMEEQL